MLDTVAVAAVAARSGPTSPLIRRAKGHVDRSRCAQDAIALTGTVGIAAINAQAVAVARNTDGVGEAVDQPDVKVKSPRSGYE